MKKLLALSLALVMALGMTSIAFADTATTYYVGGDLTDTTGTGDALVLDTIAVTAPVGFRATDGILDSAKRLTASASVTPGWTVFYLLSDAAGKPLSDSDQVKGCTVKQTWDMGKDYIDSITIVKKKYTTTGDYYYFVAIAYKASTSTTAYDIAGELNIKKTTTTTSSGATTGAPFTATLKIGTPYTFSNSTNLEIACESTKLFNFASTGGIATQNAKDAAAAIDANMSAAYDVCSDTTPEPETKYNLASSYANWGALKTDATAKTGTAVADYAKVKLYCMDQVTKGTDAIEGDQTFTTAAGHYFDVDVTGQSKILLYYDEKYNSTVAAVYPSANLDFVIFNGASFNKTGELTLLADEGSYLYALNADGSLSKIKAEYDEYEEAFKVTTRTLGKYVISDTELTLVAASSSATSSTAPVSSSTTTPVKTNPGTGAAI